MPADKTERGPLSRLGGPAPLPGRRPVADLRRRWWRRRLSHITLNWRGRPLTSHQIIVDLIGATSTATGLTVRAELDTDLIASPRALTPLAVPLLVAPACIRLRIWSLI
jgi:hypothetical protein